MEIFSETKNSFKIHFTKKKFVIEYDVVDDHEEMRDEDQPDTMDLVRLEVYFKDITDMDIFSEKNIIQLDANNHLIRKLHRGSTIELPEWEKCCVKALIFEDEDESEEEDDDDENSETEEEKNKRISLDITLERDSFGQTLCSNKTVLNRMMAVGLSFSVDGRRPQTEITGNVSLNLGQKFLPSNQEASNFFIFM